MECGGWENDVSVTIVFVSSPSPFSLTHREIVSKSSEIELKQYDSHFIWVYTWLIDQQLPSCTSNDGPRRATFTSYHQQRSQSARQSFITVPIDIELDRILTDIDMESGAKVIDTAVVMEADKRQTACFPLDCYNHSVNVHHLLLNQC